MKKIVKLCKGIFDALLVLVIIGALVLLLAPRLLGARLLVVLSQSMEPTIPMGAIVVSRTVPASEIEVGDAITFRSPDPADQSALITHRVVELVGSGIAIRFRTQGDAVEEPDLRLVTPQHLVGRVWFSVPYLGYGAHFARTPLGFILLLGLPAALLVGGEVRSMIKAARKKTASAPERAPQAAPISGEAQPSPAPSLGGKVRRLVGVVGEKTTRAVERVLSSVPISEASRVQLQPRPAAQVQDAPLWQQVQTLQVQVEALQAEVAALGRRLERASLDVSELAVTEPLHTSASPEAHLQPERGPAPELSEEIERAMEVESTDRDWKGLPPPERPLPIVVAERPAPGQAPHDLSVRLVALAGWAWLGILAGLIAVFLLVNFGLPAILPAPVTHLVAQPLLWTGLAVQAFLCWRYGLEDRPPLNVSLVVMAGLIGVFQLALLFGAGLLFGFDRLPGDFQLLTLVGNLVNVGAMLVGMEISRAYLVAVFHRHHPWLALTLLSLLFSLVSVPFARFEGMDSAASFFQATGEALLPTFCQNLLASLLAVLGGPVASLAYRAPLLAFEWLSPAQPDQKWVVTALLGSLIPILAFPVVRWHSLRRSAREKNAQTDKARSSAMWALVGTLITPLVSGGVGGIARTLRGHKPERVTEMPPNPQGR